MSNYQMAAQALKQVAQKAASSSRRTVLELKLSCYDNRVVKMAERLKTAADMLNIRMVGPVGLPTKTKRWTVLKSVFKYKKFQESFEMIIYNQKLTVDTDSETADKFLAYITDTLWPGVDMKVTKYTFDPLSSYYQHPYIKAVFMQGRSLMPPTKQNQTTSSQQ